MKVNIFKKAVNFLTEVKVELSKVSWSSKQELFGSTLVVITITFLLALFIGVVDLVLSNILKSVFR
ncbi:MAG: preprotein translocase subunit SecE [Candidatus Omnitrophota bacterium]|nr:MAG: preprotein translocase subunit SecE [Candidatus Omnitrophota bacterium]